MAKKVAQKPIEQKPPLTAEQQQEYLRCLVDIPYFAEKYCQVKDKASGKKIAFKLFPHQLQVIKAYESHRNNLILKYRQGGITSTTCLYIAWLLMFTPNIQIAVVANTLTLAQDSIFSGIVDIISNLPEWLREEPDGKDSQKKKVYANGATLAALAAGKDGTRGWSPDLIFIDEAAYLQYGQEFMTATMGAVSVGGRIILNSTPKGMDAVYYAKYEASIKGDDKVNAFNIVEIFWYEDPRFIVDSITKEPDLCWEKTIEGQVDSIQTTDPVVYKALMKQGYEPTSSWFRGMCAQYDYDPKRIAQELKGSFVGSGGNMIPDEIILEIERTTVESPTHTNDKEDGKFWFWGEVKPNATYVQWVDVSKGTGEDYSSIEIFEQHSDGILEQVAELQCKYPPEVLAKFIDLYGRKYNYAYTVIDVTGGIGVVAMDNLIRLEYPWDKIHKAEASSKPVRDRLKQHLSTMNEKELVPGFIIGANRDLILEELVRRLRHGELIIKSKRLVAEFKTFVFVNGRFDHERSKHDDLLIAVAIGCYAQRFSFGTMQGPTFDQVLLQAQSWQVVTQEDRDNEWLIENKISESKKYEPDPFRDENFSRDIYTVPFYFQ